MHFEFLVRRSDLPEGHANNAPFWVSAPGETYPLARDHLERSRPEWVVID